MKLTESKFTIIANIILTLSKLYQIDKTDNVMLDPISDFIYNIVSLKGYTNINKSISTVIKAENGNTYFLIFTDCEKISEVCFDMEEIDFYNTKATIIICPDNEALENIIDNSITDLIFSLNNVVALLLDPPEPSFYNIIETFKFLFAEEIFISMFLYNTYEVDEDMDQAIKDQYKEYDSIIDHNDVLDIIKRINYNSNNEDDSNNMNRVIFNLFELGSILDYMTTEKYDEILFDIS